jgi:hypothetical protein
VIGIGKKIDKRMKQISENAEIIALQSLRFIFENEEYQSAFIRNSGLSISDLSADLINNPETLAAALDFILEDDQNLLNFCATAKVDPKDVWRARLQLPGAPNNE